MGELPTLADVQAAVYRALEHLGLEPVRCAVAAGAATRAVEDPERELTMMSELEAAKKRARHG